MSVPAAVLHDKTAVLFLNTPSPAVTAVAESYAPLLHDLCASSGTTLISHSKTASTLSHLAGNEPPRCILTVDADLLDGRKHQELLFRIEQYVRQGGVLILGAGIHLLPQHVGSLKSRFGVNWTLSPARKTEYKINSEHPLSHSLDRIRSPLLPSYVQSLRPLKDVPGLEGLYVPVGEGVDCAVALAKVGHGYLAYLGDIHLEEGTQAVLGALLRMNM